MSLPVRFNQTFRVEVIIACVVFGLIMAVLILAIIRSYTRWGRKASQKSEYKKTELTYIGVIAATAVFLITFSISKNHNTNPPPRLKVQVVGFQWCWRFSYEGTPVTVTADCVNGHIPTLVVPTGESIGFYVTSNDVIHSMWIPHLRYKIWAYPHYVNSFRDTFIKTGSFEGQCAEFCGLYHYAMHFTLRVVTPAQFASWLHAKEVAAR